jgi:hypothetical protein
MPYIKKELRNQLDMHIDALIDHTIAVTGAHGANNHTELQLPGVLNYITTRMIAGTYDRGSPLTYSEHNSIIGMLESCKDEWYRKRTGPYEDTKEIENGKVGWFSKAK